MAARAEPTTAATPTLHTYQTPMSVTWNFDYQSPIDKLEDLYHRAKQNQWNADDLEWDTPIDPSNPLVSGNQLDYARMPFFARLSTTQQETFAAHSTAQLLSQFLHGEQGAVLTASAITHAVPDMKARFYAATQTMDEARHVEAYDRYVNKIAIHYPVVGWLKELVDATLTSGNYAKIMIGMNMIIEGLALGAFNNMYRQTNEPLLKSITFNVMRDESRHVSFGHIFLGPTVAQMHPDDREDLAQFAYDAVAILVKGQSGPMDPGFLKVLEVSGIDPDDFAAGVKEAEAQGIRQELPPGQIHSLKDLMMPALVRTGLVTARTRGMFEALGVPVSEDLRVLEAMEDSESKLNVLNEQGASY